MQIAEFSVRIVEELKKIVTEDQRVEANSIWKNNGIKEEGISIIEKGKNISPTIYLDEFFSKYRAGVTIKELAEEIWKLNEQYKVNESIDIGFFLDYENARQRIVYKLINRSLNEQLLSKIPYMEYMDLAMVFYYLIRDEELGNATILIHDSHLKMWKVSKEAIYTEALRNTPRLLPASITGMFEIISQMMGDIPLDEEEFAQETPMYVMTNTMKMNGAATMLYPDAMKEFADSLGKNLFIIPSSVHEVILVPESGTEGGRLNEMVNEVNETQVDPREVLADHVYYYDRSENQIVSCVRECVTYC